MVTKNLTRNLTVVLKNIFNYYRCFCFCYAKNKIILSDYQTRYIKTIFIYLNTTSRVPSDRHKINISTQYSAHIMKIYAEMIFFVYSPFGVKGFTCSTIDKNGQGSNCYAFYNPMNSFIVNLNSRKHVLTNLQSNLS